MTPLSGGLPRLPAISPGMPSEASDEPHRPGHEHRALFAIEVVAVYLLLSISRAISELLDDENFSGRTQTHRLHAFDVAMTESCA